MIGEGAMEKSKWQICVCGVIKFENEYLLLKRSATEENYAGFWEMPGGRLELGETVEHGLQREVFEEIGINISCYDKSIVGISEYVIQSCNEKMYCIQLNYVIDVPTKCLPIKLSDEHSSYIWATKDSEYIDSFIAEIISAIEPQKKLIYIRNNNKKEVK